MNLMTLLHLELEGQRPQVIEELERNEVSFMVTPPEMDTLRTACTSSKHAWAKESSTVIASITPSPARYG